MRASGKMIKPMERESICIKMAPRIQVNGTKTSSMALVLKNGQMVRAMKETTIWERSTATGNSHGLTDRHTREISKIT